jgi:hypothetical protein
MFDYILTGPISGVSAGQYITGLMNELMNVAATATGCLPALMDARTIRFQFDMNHTSAVFAAAVTIYYWWRTSRASKSPAARPAGHADHHRHGRDPADLGRLLRLRAGRRICRLRPRPPISSSARCAGLPQGRWFRCFGLFGILMAFGHSVLAMSGEESLAQVNREIEHPKLKNLKRAAIVIAIYSLIFTGGATLLASMLIPTMSARTSTRTT